MPLIIIKITCNCNIYIYISFHNLNYITTKNNRTILGWKSINVYTISIISTWNYEFDTPHDITEIEEARCTTSHTSVSSLEWIA